MNKKIFFAVILEISAVLFLTVFRHVIAAAVLLFSAVFVLTKEKNENSAVVVIDDINYLIQHFEVTRVLNKHMEKAEKKERKEILRYGASEYGYFFENLKCQNAVSDTTICHKTAVKKHPVENQRNAISLKVKKDGEVMGYICLMPVFKKEICKKIKTAKNLGMDIFLISKESMAYTLWVAEKCGICDSDSLYIFGHETEMVGDEELEKLTEICRIFAEVKPCEKQRILKAAEKECQYIIYEKDIEKNSVKIMLQGMCGLLREFMISVNCGLTAAFLVGIIL